MNANTIPESPAAQSAAPRKSTRRPVALVVPGTGCDHEYQGRENDRHVEREDPSPGGLVDDHASSERADDRRDSAPGRPAPIAAPRSRTANAATMIASELGTISAAAAPCNARAPMSTSIVGDSARNRKDLERCQADGEHAPPRRRCPRASRR